MSTVSLLTWLAGISSLAALVIYFVVLMRRPQWIRLLNGSGLFFTGVALSQIALLLPRAAAQGALFTIAITVALLVAAVAVQSYAALRNRRAWDGTERRRTGDEGEDR